MSTGSILSILAYPQYGYHLVCHTGLSLVHCSYLSVGSLHYLALLPTPANSLTHLPFSLLYCPHNFHLCSFHRIPTRILFLSFLLSLLHKGHRCVAWSLATKATLSVFRTHSMKLSLFPVIQLVQQSFYPIFSLIIINLEE